MAKAIGIDLGTTNSVMAHKTAHLEIIQNQENGDVTRSAVGEYKGEILVGNPAMNRMEYAPRDIVISIKRLMGRAFNDQEVQKAKGKKNFILYDIVPPTDGTEDSVRVIMGGKPYSPVQISTLILAKLKKDAEARLGDTVDQAVITVPAYFAEKQRFATREAGWKAGLKVQKILAEPTAAAIAYGLNNLGPDEAKTLLVYDFGGGTLDITVLQVVGNVFVELDKEGDMWLGGDDFDELIVNYALGKIKEDYGIDLDTHPLRENMKDRFKVVLRHKAEEAKIMLSSAQQAHLMLQGMLEDEDRNIIDIEVSITRAQFDRLAEGLVGRSLDLVKKALKNAEITPEQIDHVLLVGGSTTIPLVQRGVAALFGEDKLLRNIDPMKCVGQGAGIVAAMLGDSVECFSCGTVNEKGSQTCAKCNEVIWALGSVASMDYGIQVAGDEFYPIIMKSSPIPPPESYRGKFYTQRFNQRRIKIPVYRGETDKKASENEKMCIVWMLLPAGLPEGTLVEVSLALSGDEILDFIGVKLLDGSGKQLEAFPARGEGERAKLEDDIEQAYKKWEEKIPKADYFTVREVERLYDEVVDAATANNLELAAGKLKQFEKRVMEVGVAQLEWERRLQGIINYSEEMLHRYKELIPPEGLNELKKLVDEAKEAIRTKNQILGEEKYQELDKKTDEFVAANQLMLLRNHVSRAKDQGMVGEGDALTGIISQAESAAASADVPRFNRNMEEAKVVLDKIRAKGGMVVKGGDDLLTTQAAGRTPAS